MSLRFFASSAPRAAALSGLLVLTSRLFAVAPAAAQPEAWPAGASPREIGSLVTERFLASPHTNFGRAAAPRYITYPETCTWYGALRFAEASGRTDLTRRLVHRFDPLFGPEAHLIPKPLNVDLAVFAAVPLELYQVTHDARYRLLGLGIADAQWTVPADGKLKPDVQRWVGQGLSWHTRFWVDDMFMITMAQAQAYRATGDRRYIDRAAAEMAAYLDALQQPSGLFYHAPDVPYYWGRGNGWMAAGMSELLTSLPADHPLRPKIMAGYQKMMAALLHDQDANGLWHELVDDPQAWAETSGSGMFTFAFITGVKHGWLDAATYRPAARRAWLGLVAHLETNGDMRDVCQGTNKKNSRQYYLDRKRLTGDMHGQAPVLWCAAAWLR